MNKYSKILLLLAASPAVFTGVHAATVLVSDIANSKVLSYDVTGGSWTLNGTFADSGNSGAFGFTNPRGIATDGSNVYIATSSNILRYDTSGNFLGSVLTVSGADGLAVDSSGNIYYTVAFGGGATQGLYSITDPTGTASNSLLVADSDILRGVAIGGNGNLFVAERAAGVVTEYETDGTLVGTFLTVNFPVALTWDGANNQFLLGYSAAGDGYKADIGAISTSGTLSALYNYQSTNPAYYRTNLSVIDVDGTVYGSSFASISYAVASVDSLTEASTVVSGFGAGYMAVIVPEPSAVALFLGAAALVLGVWRRRRAN